MVGHITFAQSVLISQLNCSQCLDCTFYQCKPRSDGHDTKIQCGLPAETKIMDLSYQYD